MGVLPSGLSGWRPVKTKLACFMHVLCRTLLTSKAVKWRVGRGVYREQLLGGCLLLGLCPLG